MRNVDFPDAEVTPSTRPVHEVTHLRHSRHTTECRERVTLCASSVEGVSTEIQSTAELLRNRAHTVKVEVVGRATSLSA